MKKYLLILVAFLLATGAASAQQNLNTSDSDISPGITLASPFYGVEMFVENLEVKLAGAIGGNDMKAKALANNAEERVSEAQNLIENNRSDKAAEAIERYSQTLNKSVETASKGQNEELKQKINNISNNNVEKLKEVRKKVPDQAKGAIDRAIDRSERRKGPPKKAMNRTDNPSQNRTERPETPDKVREHTKGQKENLENHSSNPAKNRSEDLRRNISEKRAEVTTDTEKAINSTEDPASSETSGEGATGNNKITENNSLTDLR